MATYIVKSGDSLSKIALQFYGDAGRYREIAEANDIENPNLIHVGDLLDIPEETDSSPSYSSSTPEVQQLQTTQPSSSNAAPAPKTDPNKQFLGIAAIVAVAAVGYWVWSNKEKLMSQPAAAQNPDDEEVEFEDEDEDEDEEE